MREIKFRAWKKEVVVDDFVYEGEMIYADSMSNCEYIKRYVCIAGFYSDSGWDWNDFEFMQYTGLKDKHGREIYEGDILSCKSSSSCYQKYGEKYLVYWDDKKTGFECAYQYGLEGYMQNENIEVIGNVHENPELLEQE